MRLDNIEISLKLEQLYKARFGKKIYIQYGGREYHITYSGSGKLIVIDLKTGKIADGRKFLKYLPIRQTALEEIRRRLLL